MIKFDGRIVQFGFGAVGKSFYEKVKKEIEFNENEYFVITMDNFEFEAFANLGGMVANFINQEITKENFKEKHNKDAKYGWYKYISRFALPVYCEGEEIERYNVFRVVMIVRHAEDEKMYLYDIMNIKKETSTLFQS